MCKSLRKHLVRLTTLLHHSQEDHLASLVEEALSASDENLRTFLRSNELWGGPGSIADQAGCEGGRKVKQRIESVLIDLGEEQIRDGILNERTGMWVDTFRYWKESGV